MKIYRNHLWIVIVTEKSNSDFILMRNLETLSSQESALNGSSCAMLDAWYIQAKPT